MPLPRQRFDLKRTGSGTTGTALARLPWTPDRVRGDSGGKRTAGGSAAAGLALALLGAGAAGCGFQPLYATDGSARGELARVQIEQIPDRTGQQLRNALLLGFPPGDPNAPAAWRLRVTLTESKQRLGVVKQDVATRANLTLTARYELEDAAAGSTATEGELRSVNSYNILESPYATLAAERNARTRGVRQIADGLTARLAAWLSRPRNGQR